MLEKLQEKKKSIHEFFLNYGKLVTLFLFFLLSGCFVYFIFNFNISQKLRISFLDVGQGDAILIQTPSGKKMLIDGGPSNLILERLSEKISFFDKDIDVLEETHPDADHITGLIPVLENFKVSKIIISKAKSNTKVFEDLEKHIREEGSEVFEGEKGDEINFNDGVVVKVLYPYSNYVVKKSDTNDASISVLVTYENESFLLTGDLPSSEEQKIITNILPRNVTVYKAGHHGSKYSSGEQLLSYIHPEYAIISAGKNNKYSHPNQETIDRLQKYSKEIISTIDRGTITFLTDGKIMEIESDR